MEMQRVWAVYFSGTGTTEKVVTRMAKIAAEDLGAEYKPGGCPICCCPISGTR